MCCKRKRNVHTEDTTSHGEKKKEKKKEVPSTGIELANFDLIVSWFHPLRHSGMNWEITFNFSKLKPTRRSLVPYTKTKPIFSTLKPRLTEHPDTQTVSFFFLACSKDTVAVAKTSDS